MSSLALVRCLLISARVSKIEGVSDQVEKLIIKGQTNHTNSELITPMLERGYSSRRTTM